MRELNGHQVSIVYRDYKLEWLPFLSPSVYMYLSVQASVILATEGGSLLLIRYNSLTHKSIAIIL